MDYTFTLFLRLLEFSCISGIILGTWFVLLITILNELDSREKRRDVGKELDELLKDLPDIEEDEGVQIYPWFKEDDLAMCIEKSSTDLELGEVYVVESVEIRNNIEFIRLRELRHTGISYYSKSFALIGEK